MYNQLSSLRRDCTFCDKKNVNYSCPKCGQYYCSIDCYNNKKHLNCSEQFYKKNVEDELKLQSKESNDNLKRTTLEILKRDYDNLINEEENDYDLDELKEKFNKLNLQNIDDLWNYLEDNEKKKFNDLLKQNQIINLLPVDCWTPWYLKIKQKSNLIEELNNDKESNYIEFDNENELNNDKKSNDAINKELNSEFNDDDDNYELSKTKFIKEIENKLNELNSKIPSIDLSEIKKLTNLTKIKPSSNVKCTILNLILSYCYMCRYFNNDHLSFINESFNLINEISLLNQKTIYTSTRQSIQYTIQLLINQKNLKIDFILILIDDLKFIIENNQKIYLNIINDLINLFKQYKKILKRRILKNDKKIKDNNDKDILINEDQLNIKEDQLLKQTNSNSNQLEEINDLKKDLPIESDLKENLFINSDLRNNLITKSNLKDKKIDNDLKVVNLLLKKLEYYLSYLNEYRDELLDEVKEIEMERLYLSSFKRSIDENNKKNEIKIY